MKLSDLKGYKVVSPAATPSAPIVPRKDFLEQATDIATTIFPGTRAIGEALGTAAVNIGKLAKGENPDIPVNVPAQIGGTIQAATLPVGLGAIAPARLAATAAQYGGLGATSAAGESLTRGNDIGTVAADATKGAAIGGAIGGVFNLLGKGITTAAQKFGPSALEFTSGVPKAAIEQVAKNPETAKAGIKMPLAQVREQAETSLNTLQADLSSEFKQGLAAVANMQADTTALAPKLFNNARNIAATYKVGLQGATPVFNKSAIVSAGEQNAVKGAFETLKTWDDFSAQGMEDLSTRIGAFKNWDEAGTTRSSAIVGKIYGAVNDAIKTHYPELATLRTNYSKNREVLDTISDVLNATKDNVKSQQTAVTRLDNIFRDNRDLYLNAIRQLSERSGTDILSLLAGGELQRLLPGYIRGFGGAATVGVASTFVNPWAILLSPLFSPRGAGFIARNAEGTAKTTSALSRTAATAAIGQTASAKADSKKQ